MLITYTAVYGSLFLIISFKLLQKTSTGLWKIPPNVQWTFLVPIWWDGNSGSFYKNKSVIILSCDFYLENLHWLIIISHVIKEKTFLIYFKNLPDSIGDFLLFISAFDPGKTVSETEVKTFRIFSAIFFPILYWFNFGHPIFDPEFDLEPDYWQVRNQGRNEIL